MYSQNDEEKWIIDYYKNYVGRFLDIGANDGISLSCTHRLTELGWEGVCVAPSPSAFTKLQKLYQSNPKIIVVNCAVDVDSKLKEFYYMPEGYASTLNIAFMESKFPGLTNKYQSMYLKTIEFNELLFHFGNNFDFVKIDIEGMDFEVLKIFPFNFLPKLNMICIEHGRCTYLSDMIEIGKINNFCELVVTPQNLIMVKD